MLVLPAAGLAQPTTSQRVLTDAERQAVLACLTLVRGCQMPNGAFAQVTPGDKTNAPVWVAPYFANYAALALLAEYTRTGNADELTRVGRWLDWCAKNQAKAGCWNDFEGTSSACADSGKVDAWDSSAALFLMVAGRYHRAGGPATPALQAAAAKAVACIATTTDQDGLTWAKPDFKVKYLMDNVEVCAGLRAAAGLFAAAGSKREAKQAGDQAERIAKKLGGYWRPDHALFAFALHANGTFESGLEKAYPHGLAQLFGIAFVDPKAAAWGRVAQAFSPEAGPASGFGTEWWLIAASRLDERETKAWRAKMVKEIAAFTPTVYVSRPALAVLGLLEGANWMARLAAPAAVAPDIRSVEPDLTVPAMTTEAPAAGRRVKMTLAAYQGTEVYHALYLPADWQAGKRFPVIVEYAGNGSYSNRYGDVCDGRVESCKLGYGASGGKGFLWVCAPYISPDRKRNQPQWWGDVEATAGYCTGVVAEVCAAYGGDPSTVFLAGFSRGAIACNYIGLHNDGIAALWRGFICHSHYDGVRAWGYAESDRASAGVRLARLKGRPQFISQEGSTAETQAYLKSACPAGRFMFVPLPFRNHTDAWTLRDIPERAALRAWLIEASIR